MKGTRSKRQEELIKNRIWEETDSIYDLFRKVADRFPDRDFIITEDHVWSYSEVRDRVLVYRQRLLRIGIKSGDHAAIVMDNQAQYVFLILALSSLNVVKIPLVTKLTPERILQDTEQVDAQFLFLLPGIAEKLTESGIPFPESLRMCVSVGQEADAGTRKMTYWPPVSREEEQSCSFITDHGLEETDGERAQGSDLSDFIFTSGSTHRPKAVMLTHRMLLQSAWSNCMNRGFEQGRRVYVPVPLYHVYGYIEGLLSVMMVGGAVILDRSRFTADRAISLICELHADDMLAVPSMAMKMLESERAGEIKNSRMHAIYVSAAACPDWVWTGLQEKMGITDRITGYGMTEVSGASVQTCPSDGTRILTKYVGKPLAIGTDGKTDASVIAYRVIDRENGQDVVPGIAGELWCKGKIVTPGYYKEEIINREVFTPDGWFKTGDVGIIGQNEYIQFLGRKDDTYKINGENVSPAYIESVILRCHYVREASVVPVQDERVGQKGVAFVELEDDCLNNRNDLERFLRENLAGFQVPANIIYLGRRQWPRSANGKVKKSTLKEMAKTILMDGSLKNGKSSNQK